MSAKRKTPSSTAIHPSRREQVPEDVGAPTHKKRKTNPHPGRNLQPKTRPINPIKSRIRSLQRMLEHNDGLPADIRIGHERELQSCKWELEEAKKEERRKETIGKYHMVRFFDRQKATRRLKKVKKAAEESDRQTRVNDVLHAAEVDLNYALYYPLDQPYVALYPKDKKSKKQDALSSLDADEQPDVDVRNDEGGVKDHDGNTGGTKGDSAMWKLVERCMAENKLDALRNGKVYSSGEKGATLDQLPPLSVEERKIPMKSHSRNDIPSAKRNTARGQDKKRRQATSADKEASDSEGGFFE
ncbi:rRNA-processing protein efg1 [Elasticomyces elasticus]|nr:rRNA-processing protein efg1 [Elasticomyces elasticus]KAK4956930.1 hypothetical protein LTR28_005809 [Elasticomyces elasticus]